MSEKKWHRWLTSHRAIEDYDDFGVQMWANGARAERTTWRLVIDSAVLIIGVNKWNEDIVIFWRES